MKSNNSFEQARLLALKRLSILDSPAEKEYDEIVELAARFCEVPISLVSLVAEDRQWFKSRTGLAATETHRSISFCDHALHQNDIFLVRDALQDPRFANNPSVTGEPFIRFYAGAPIASPDGHKLGTLCIIDKEPRELTWSQASALKTLAAQVSQLLALRQANNTIFKLQTDSDAKQLRVEKLRQEKRRKVQLSEVALQTAASFLSDELTVLKTGKFTKKELSVLAQKAAAMAAQLQSFKQGLAVLARLHSEAPVPTEAVSIPDLLETIQTELADNLKSASVKLQTFVPDNLTIKIYPSLLHLVVSTLLQTFLFFLQKTEMAFEADERVGFVELRFSIPNHDIRDALQQTETETGVQLSLTLVRDVVADAGGQLFVSRFGNRGTTVTVQLPQTTD